MAKDDADAARFASMCEKARLNYKTANVRARAWVEYMLANIQHATAPSLMRLGDRFRGMPAFIVGSGPSLDGNMGHLAEAKRKGLVIAVNGAGAVLPEAPHVTLSIEAEDTRVLLGDTRDSIRAFSLSCHPEVMTHGEGLLSPTYLTNPTGALRTLTGIPRLETSISASTTATSLAYILGCSPIVLVGQDMAYPGGQTYSNAMGGGSLSMDGTYTWGTVHQKLSRELSPLPETERLVECEAWGGGGVVKTSMPWLTMNGYLQSCAEVWDRAMINCTEGGARVQGWAEAPLSWLLTQLDTEAPTTAELADMMRAEGPLVAPELLGEFLGAQSVGAAMASLRAATMASLARECASTIGDLPLPVRKALEWVWSPSAWARSWTERAVNEELLFYQRTEPREDLAEERLAEAWALHSACEAIEPQARELSDRIQEAM
jgi:hypothetical protein